MSKSSIFADRLISLSIPVPCDRWCMHWKTNETVWVVLFICLAPLHTKAYTTRHTHVLFCRWMATVIDLQVKLTTSGLTFDLWKLCVECFGPYPVSYIVIHKYCSISITPHHTHPYIWCNIIQTTLSLLKTKREKWDCRTQNGVFTIWPIRI